MCETLHKTFKDAYHWSNHIDSIAQIIQGYTKEYNFAVHEMELEFVAKGDPDIMGALSDIFRHKETLQDLVTDDPSVPIYMRLEGPRSRKEIYHLDHISKFYMLEDLNNQMEEFLQRNNLDDSWQIPADVQRWFSDVCVKAFNGVGIPVPDQDIGGKGAYKIQHLKATGAKGWRGGNARKDPVWVNIKTTNIHVAAPGGRMASFQNKLPDYLNALFTMRTPSGCILKLAHVTLL